MVQTGFHKSLKGTSAENLSDYDKIIAQATHDKVDIEYRMRDSTD